MFLLSSRDLGPPSHGCFACHDLALAWCRRVGRRSPKSGNMTVLRFQTEERRKASINHPTSMFQFVEVHYTSIYVYIYIYISISISEHQSEIIVYPCSNILESTVGFWTAEPVAPEFELLVVARCPPAGWLLRNLIWVQGHIPNPRVSELWIYICREVHT